MGNRTLHYYAGKKRIQTNKIIDRLLYDGKKKRKTGPCSKRLANKTKSDESTPITPLDTQPNLKFGSFNVRGLDLETFWAVEEIVLSRNFDVKIN